MFCALTNLLAEVKVALFQQAEELLDGGNRGGLHIHQGLVVPLGLPGPPERLQPNDCVHLLPAEEERKRNCERKREGVCVCCVRFSHVVPQVLQSLPVGNSLPPHPDQGLELRREAENTAHK